MKREWLIAYRRAKGLTQKEVADAIGCSQVTYSTYENGKRRPTTKIAKKIGRIFNFEWTIFFDEENEED